MYYLINAEFPFWTIIAFHIERDTLEDLMDDCEENYDGLLDVVDDKELESIKIKYPQCRSTANDPWVWNGVTDN